MLGLLSGAKAANALNVTTPAAATTTYIVGAPMLTFTYSGTGVARHADAGYSEALEVARRHGLKLPALR